jgi:prefoldin subunit 5
MDIQTTKLAIHNLKLQSGRPEDLAMQYDYLTHKLSELEAEIAILN